MVLPIRQQARYWGIAALVFLAVLWVLGIGNVILPFVVGGMTALVGAAVLFEMACVMAAMTARRRAGTQP